MNYLTWHERGIKKISPWVLVAKWIERPPCVREVMGSIPVGERYGIVDHRSYTTATVISSCEIKSWFNPWPLLTSAVLYQLSGYGCNLVLVTTLVRNIPVDSEECKWIYEISYICTAQKDMKTYFATREHEVREHIPHTWASSNDNLFQSNFST